MSISSRATLAVLIAAMLTIAELANRPSNERRERPPFRGGPWLAAYLLWSIPTATAIAWLTAWVAHRSPLRAQTTAQPIVLQAFEALIVSDLVVYGVHRLMHRFGWRLHFVHHRSSPVRWWSAFCVHPLDGVAAHATPLLVAAMIGFRPTTLSTYLGVAFVVTVFAHADVALPERCVKWLVVTPTYHRLHHTEAASETNFAQLLPALDRLFGTHAGGTHRKSSRPTDNDTTFATELAMTARGSATPSVRTSSAASKYTIATSTSTSAAVAPSSFDKTG
jgi:sterol desaturase/sphingolipid hydroxylase (fatty acid hydroxylase superfamily)